MMISSTSHSTLPSRMPTSASSSIMTPTPSTIPTLRPTSPSPTESTSVVNILLHQYATGIQYNSVASSDLLQLGCTTCYDVPYSSWTTASNITSCIGPNLFVGARLSNSSTFLLGAYDSADTIHKKTAVGTAHFSNGVYWYFVSNYSFGFLDSPDLFQNEADVGDTSSDSRLSWHLDLLVGGYRAGSHVDLNFNTSFRKAIYTVQR